MTKKITDPTVYVSIPKRDYEELQGAMNIDVSGVPFVSIPKRDYEELQVRRSISQLSRTCRFNP